jgi:hypothetical protein
VVAQEVCGVDGGGGYWPEESGVDGGGGDRWSRERWRLREFWDEKQNDTGRILFIGSKISVVILVLNRC